jgi:hypothetical protein
MSYTPPSGTAVSLDFADGYATPPAAKTTLEFDTPSYPAAVGGFTSAACGEPTVTGQGIIRTKGADASKFGMPLAERAALRIYPDSINQSAIGDLTASWTQHVTASSINEPATYYSVSRVRNLGGYIPPPGINLVLNWTGAVYDLPPADSLTLEFGAVGYGTILGVSLGNTADYGSPTVSQAAGSLTIAPSGIDSAHYGVPVVQGTNQVIYVSSFGGDRSGFTGGDSAGDGRVYLNQARLTPAGINELAFGAPLVADELRYVVPSGVYESDFGAASVTFAVRTVSPTGFIAYRASTGHAMVTARTLSATGFTDEDIGSAVVDYRVDRILPPSIAPGLVGSPDVILDTQRIIQGTTAYDPEWGRPEVHNASQYIFPNDWRIQDGPEVWGEKFSTFYPLVENRNRTLIPQGFDALKIPRTHLLENNARVLLPNGISATVFGSERDDNRMFVSYKIRTILAGGEDWFSTDRFNQVWNAARVLEPTGFQREAFGLASIVSNLQTVRAVGVAPLPIAGSELVAYAIRTVAPSEYRMNDLFIPEPMVALAVRTIAPAGIDLATLQFGGPVVESHIITFFPKSILSTTKWGDAHIRNKTPEIKPYAYEQTLWGRPLVRRDKYYIRPVGEEQTTFSRFNWVSDTKQYIDVPGSKSILFGRAIVENDFAGDPVAQIISDVGLKIVQWSFGTARLNDILPPGIDAITFGSARVRGNLIAPKSILPLDYNETWGVPSLNATQYIYPLLFAVGNEDNPDPANKNYRKPVTAHGKPDMSHLTIWCRGDVTEQTIANNGGKTWEDVDFYLHKDGQFGLPNVIGKGPQTLVFRSAFPEGGQTLFGNTVASNYRRTIYPQGSKFVKFGIPTIPSGIPIMQGETEDSLLFGEPAVAHYSVPFSLQTVVVEGKQELKIPRHTVELKNRAVSPVGFDSLLMKQGSDQIPYNPFWNPYVGPPIPIAPEGIKAGVVSELAYIDFKIRHLRPEGIDAFTTGYEFGYLHTETKVKHSGAETYGIYQGGVGRPEVGYVNRWPAPELKPLVCPIGWGD